MLHPLVRLDYILVSRNIVQNLSVAGIEKNNITDELSDHYPAFAKWKVDQLLRF